MPALTPQLWRVHVLAHESRGSFFSTAIRWQTRSDVTHISVSIDGCIYEAMQGKGVRVLGDLDWDGKSTITPYRVPAVTDHQAERLREFLCAQVGKAYDYRMIARFVSRINRESMADQEKWFCSELAFAAFRHAGLLLLRRTEPWEVSPGMLVRSPYLVEEAPGHPLWRMPEQKAA